RGGGAGRGRAPGGERASRGRLALTRLEGAAARARRHRRVLPRVGRGRPRPGDADGRRLALGGVGVRLEPLAAARVQVLRRTLPGLAAEVALVTAHGGVAARDRGNAQVVERLRGVLAEPTD